MKKSARSPNDKLLVSKRAARPTGTDGAPVPERRQFLTYMEPDLIIRVKILAIEQGRHAYEVVEDAVRAYLKARKA